MAHSLETRNKVIQAYVKDGLPLTTAASTNGVNYDTARDWKKKAKAEGDDWDKAKAAYQISSQSNDKVIELLVGNMVRQALKISEQLENADIPATDKVALLASISDAMAKFSKSMSRIDPKLGALSVALDTLRTTAKYLEKHDRVALAQFQEHLDGIGAILQSRYG